MMTMTTAALRRFYPPMLPSQRGMETRLLWREPRKSGLYPVMMIAFGDARDRMLAAGRLRISSLSA
jgi:hypothetical protein